MTTAAALSGTELARTRFFPRQLLTADDLNTEQQYFRQKLRNHNRFLHGWGVVCGCEVQPAPEKGKSWQVRISPGYVLTPQGDEVLIGMEALFDLATCGMVSDDPCAFAKPCPPSARVALIAKTVWVAVRSIECDTRPVRVSSTGCGCDDDATCEYSRALDAYEFGCLLELPPSYPPAQVGCKKLKLGLGPFPCPADPTDPWVVLATMKVPKTDRAAVTLVKADRDRHNLYATASLQELAFC